MQYSPSPYAYTAEAVAARQRGAMNRVYLWMTGGLLVTATVAQLTARSEALLRFIYGNVLVFFGLLIAEIFLVGYLALRVQKLSVGAATGIFVGYAALNGLTLAGILLAYTGESIAATFLVTAGTFGVMSLIGYTTKADLSRVGMIALMGLIGIIVASLINIFLRSSGLAWVISIIGVIIFVALTAADTQKIKRLMAQSDDQSIGKLAIMGALTLYLDFINLFLFLLRLMGGSRN